MLGVESGGRDAGAGTEAAAGAFGFDCLFYETAGVSACVCVARGRAVSVGEGDTGRLCAFLNRSPLSSPHA